MLMQNVCFFISSEFFLFKYLEPLNYQKGHLKLIFQSICELNRASSTLGHVLYWKHLFFNNEIIICSNGIATFNILYVCN